MNIDSEREQPDAADADPLSSSESESSEVELDVENTEEERAAITSDRIQTCVETKHTRSVVRHKSITPATAKLEQLHCNLWGPHSPASWADSSFVSVLIDKLTKKSWVLFLKSKDSFFDVFKL